jgi:hypothetical protein
MICLRLLHSWISKVSDHIQYHGLFYKSSSASIMKPISKFFFFFSNRKYSFGWRRNMFAAGNIYRVPSCPLSCTICTSMIPPNPRCSFHNLCWWHVHICDISQTRLYYHKSCNAASHRSIRGVSAVTHKSMKIRHKPPTCLVDVD